MPHKSKNAFTFLVVGAGVGGGYGAYLCEVGFLTSRTVAGSLAFVSGYTIISALLVGLLLMMYLMLLASVVRFSFMPQEEWQQMRGLRRPLALPCILSTLVLIPMTVAAMQVVGVRDGELHVWALQAVPYAGVSEENCDVHELHIDEEVYDNGNVEQFFVTPQGTELRNFLGQRQMNMLIASQARVPVPRIIRR